MCQHSLELENPKKGRVGQTLVVADVDNVHGGKTTAFTLTTGTDAGCGVCLQTGFGLLMFLSAVQVKQFGLNIGDRNGASVWGRFLEAEARKNTIRDDAIEFALGDGSKVQIAFDKRFIGATGFVDTLPGKERVVVPKTKKDARNNSFVPPQTAYQPVVGSPFGNLGSYPMFTGAGSGSGAANSQSAVAAV